MMLVGRMRSILKCKQISYPPQPPPQPQNNIWSNRNDLSSVVDATSEFANLGFTGHSDKQKQQNKKKNKKNTAAAAAAEVQKEIINSSSDADAPWNVQLVGSNLTLCPLV